MLSPSSHYYERLIVGKGWLWIQWRRIPQYSENFHSCETEQKPNSEVTLGRAEGLLEWCFPWAASFPCPFMLHLGRRSSNKQITLLIGAQQLSKRTWGVRRTKSTHLQDMTAIIVTRGVELMHVRVKCKRLVHLTSFEKPAIRMFHVYIVDTTPHPTHTHTDSSIHWLTMPQHGGCPLPAPLCDYRRLGRLLPQWPIFRSLYFCWVLNHVSPSFCWVWIFTSTPTN